MNAGAYINLPDRNGDTNLIHAAKAGHFSIVDALIRKYADIDLAGAVSYIVIFCLWFHNLYLINCTHRT